MKDIDTSRYTITESGNVIRGICGGNRMKIRKLYDEVLRQKNKLDIATEQLSKRAFEIYGKNLIADLCGDGEIEFRLSDYDNPNSTGENTFCVETTIEELEKMELQAGKTNLLRDVERLEKENEQLKQQIERVYMNYGS